MTTTNATSQPAHTNRLINSTSPYLLQHAHNPVDWYPWGAEALEKARKESKPIFLSIGYSACHWCHVMERESFENEEVAQIMNKHFVPIKVDREERPDLDEIYMNATMLANQGQGGWPMSVFLTPDQKPFFAGTYFPPEDKFGRPGFKAVLRRIADMWEEDPSQIEKYAVNLADAVQQFSSLQPGGDIIPLATVSKAVNGVAGAFDRSTGGLVSGGTNKFPPSMAMTLMLREYHRTLKEGKPKTELLELVELTLDHMANGGIYDHLGGGIARYSTDTDWLVPHFEKMLYDQALVSSIYLEAFQLTRNKRYADVARDILNYVLRDLQSPEGGFYSARDADSEGVEGKFYVWEKAEVMAVLGEKVGELFCSYYDVTDAGNWEGHNIINIQRDLETAAKLNKMEPAELERILAGARQKLLDMREKRIHPGLDDKVLTSWNGLMIASFARAGRLLHEPRYIDAAAKAADFILTRMTKDGRLLRTYRKGQAQIGGYLDDHAFFVESLLNLYEATFDYRWLSEADRLNDAMIEHFWDDAHGAFFFTANDAEQLLVRTKDTRDSAIPSGNSVALMNLLRLSLIFDRKDLLAKAEGTMKAFAKEIEQSPFSFDRMLAGVLFYHSPKREVVLLGSPTDEKTQKLIHTVDQVYDPHKIVLIFEPTAKGAAEWQAKIPLLVGKTLIDGQPAAYVCRNYTCRRPVTQPEELARELQAD